MVKVPGERPWQWGTLCFLPVSTRKAFFFDTRVLCKLLKRVLSIALRNQTVGLDLGFPALIL